MVRDRHDRNGDRELPAQGTSAFPLDRAAGPGPLGEPTGSFDEGAGPDWRRLLEGIWRWKWLVLATTLLGVGAGVFLMQRSEPIYETRATIWLGPSDEDQGPIKPADIFEGQGWADLLASQAVLEPVARSERVFVQPLDNIEAEQLGDLEVTSELVPGTYRLRRTQEDGFALSRGDEEVQTGELGSDVVGEPVGFRWSPEADVVPPESEASFRVVRPTEAANRLRSQLQVNYNPSAGNLINTELEWASPEGATTLHNEVLDSFMTVAERLKSQKLNEVVSILEQQTEYAAVRLDSAELALENFRVETVTLPSEPRVTSIPEDGASTSGSGAGSNVFNEFFERKLELDQLQSRAEDLRQILRTAEEEGDLNVLSLRMNPATDRSEQLTAALDELTNVRVERRTMLSQYTEEYPPVQRLTDRIQSLEQEVIPELVRNLVGQLETRVDELDRQTQGRAAELREVPARSIREAQLRREVEMAERLHNDLSGRLKEAELAARTNLPDLQVVDRASQPGGPAENPGPRLFLIASLAGVGLGIGSSLLLDRMDSKVRYPDQVTAEIGLPVLGLVPRIPERDRSGERPEEVLEAFRAIRGQLTRGGDSRDSIYFVTSPSPKEGKTLVVANLGISFAAAGSRTLVVDCDTRRGNLDRFFSVPPSPGLTEYLQDRAGLGEIEVPTEFDGLTVIPRGDLSGFRPELLDSSRMDDFLRDVRGRHDIVLLDGPPLMAGADAMIVGERTDGLLFVLRTGKSDQEAARARLAGIGNFDLPVIGAVMNDVPAGRRYYQNYYYSYQPAELETAAVART
ncbi:MAG: GumC family protein [Gemmatimonadota bacterium]